MEELQPQPRLRSPNYRHVQGLRRNPGGLDRTEETLPPSKRDTASSTSAVTSRTKYAPIALIVTGLTITPYGSVTFGLFLAFAVAYLLVGLTVYVTDAADRMIETARNLRRLEEEEE